MTTRAHLSLVVALVAAVAPAASAQPSRAVDKDTFFQMESVSAPSISPDGRQVVFTRSSVDLTKDQTQGNLWIVDTRGQRLRQLTEGVWRDSAAVWSPDGTRIAFLSNRSGAIQVHVLFADTRETLQLTRFDREPRALAWSPDGRSIAFIVSVPDESPVLDVKLPKVPKTAQLAKGATVIDRLVWARDGVGPIAKGYDHVFVVDASVGGTPRQVTAGNYDHNAFDWSPDGATLYVSGMRKPDAEYAKWQDTEIYAVDVKSGEAKALTSREGADSRPVVSPDGKRVAYTGFDDTGSTFHLQSLYVMDASGANSRLWVGGLPSSPGNVTWAPDGTGVYYTMQERGVEHLYFAGVASGSTPRKLTAGTVVFSDVSLSRTGQVAAVRTSVTEPGVLTTFALASPSQVTVLVDVNRDVLEGRQLADAEEIWFTAPDGVRAQGWLMKPVGWQPGRKYPLLLWIHGGPWSMYSVAWNWAWQNFAAQGYGVLWTNPRGSTGYGQDFVNGIQHSYPGKDYDDLMAAVDTAVATGWVDTQNLFVCGGSGGGVLTAWTVGHTNRFRAAVSMRPVINWHSFVGTTDSAMWYRQFKKYPWEDPMEYAVRSPLSVVANVTTPTMVMTGEADLRTPISQSEEYYKALKMVRKAETLLVRMPEEFHGWRRPSHQLLQQLYLQAWFEKYRVRGDGETTASR